MAMSFRFKKLVEWSLPLFTKKEANPPRQVSLSDLQFIWNYQMVVVDTTTTIDLIVPLLDISQSLDTIPKEGRNYPLIVGDHGQLISPTSARRVLHPGEPQKTSIYLDFVLNDASKSKLVLRIIGNDPQSLFVVRDERRTNTIPLILFFPKLKRSPQEK